MAKKKKQQIEEEQIEVKRGVSYCSQCKNRGTETYELVFICKIDGERRNSKIDCVNFKSKNE